MNVRKAGQMSERSEFLSGRTGPAKEVDFRREKVWSPAGGEPPGFWVRLSGAKTRRFWLMSSKKMPLLGGVLAEANTNLFPKRKAGEMWGEFIEKIKRRQ